MGRFDLLRPVTALGSRITTWTKLCDARLHRLVCYIKGTISLKMYGWIGDKRDKLELVLYCDADLAGDRNDAKSTSGIFMCLVGPTSFMPLAAVSKKQTSVSKSTPEAEIVAIDHGLSKHALPALTLWENILGKQLSIRLMEDNAAACRVVITGRNPSMRHMSRTQCIDVAWINERYVEKSFVFIECPSEYQAGDLMTKHFTDAKVWSRNLHLVGHLEDSVFYKAFVKTKPSAAAEPITCDNELREATADNGLMPAAAAANNTHIPVRFSNNVHVVCDPMYIMIEFCAFFDSRLSSSKNHKGKCMTYIIDDAIDGRSYKALELMKIAIKQGGANTVLWGSLPCTGGCTWNYINGQTPEGRARIEEHILLMTQLLKNFIIAAKLVIENNGIVCFEWPKKCTYWKRRDIQNMLNELGLEPAHFDGCSFGLKSTNRGKEHMFLKKPWTVYSNCPILNAMLSKRTCSGVNKHHEHDQCRGKNAKGSERYTDEFARSVHCALRSSIDSYQCAPAVLVAKVDTDVSEPLISNLYCYHSTAVVVVVLSTSTQRRTLLACFTSNVGPPLLGYTMSDSEPETRANVRHLEDEKRGQTLRMYR